VGSKARLEIESVACLSVRAFQFVPPSVVFQMPPPGVPMKRVFASRGSATTGPTAPATCPLGGASRLWMISASPKLGAGPCVTKLWLTWTCAAAAVGSANAVAITNPRHGPNMAPPPGGYARMSPRRIVPEESGQRAVESRLRSRFFIECGVGDTCRSMTAFNLARPTGTSS
jgi:hypothetical protein